MPRDKKTIAIVHSDIAPGAPPDEQDTLAMAGFIRPILERRGWNPVCIPYRPRRLKADLEAANASLIFNLVESINGRGDALDSATDLFSRLGYAFTGTDSAGLRATADKIAAKAIFERHNLMTPPFLDEPAIAAAQAAGPFILKSRSEEASFGLFQDSVAGDAAALRAVLRDRKARYGGEWFAEAFIEGREFHVPVLGTAGKPRVLTPGEIDFNAFPPGMPRFIDYAAKWDADSFQYQVTSYLFDSAAPALAARLRDLAARCWDAFGLNGSARIDVRLGQDDLLYVLDINANPCLAPPCIFIEAGLSYDEIIDTLIAAAVNAQQREYIDA